ncbi:MAG TPA: arginine--tRNA ligase [Aggregatilineales bacterium]|nr:arginine--tRNA ligase [Aggregatilineales bacterium]
MGLLTHELAAAIGRAIVAAQSAGQLPSFQIPPLRLDRPKRADQGDYASAVAMQVQKQVGRPPLDIAKTIAAHFPSVAFVGGVEIAPPGFLNIRLSDPWLAQQVDHIVAAGDRVFQSSRGAGKKAQVEYVSANPTGPLSVHRIRGGVIGDTLGNLLAASGYEVSREYYYNNGGRQMDVLGASVQARYLEMLGLPNLFPPDGYRGLYIRMIAATLIALRGDSLKDASVAEFRTLAARAVFERIRNSMHRVNINHDVFFNESSLYEDGAVWQTVEALRQAGFAYDRDGAVWFKSTALGDEKDRVIVKKTGEPTYRLPDMAYHKNKLERGFDLIVDVFGADHAATAPQVLLGVRALGYDPSIVRTVIHQMIELAEGGETKRMSTRKGDFVELDELIDDVGADAVRYFMLAQNPNTAMTFDLTLAREQGDENPVYRIQNAHVRCAGILRKAAEAGVSDEDADVSHLGVDELAFIRRMLELEEVIDRAVTELSPQDVAYYALNLAGAFHPLYDKVRVLSEVDIIPPDVQKARLRFYRAAKVVFARTLQLMGMSAPEVMERRDRAEKVEQTGESEPPDAEDQPDDRAA